MSTCSHIGILYKNGKVEVAYCKYDSDLENNGAILFANYNNYDLAYGLICRGNFDSLGIYEDDTKYFEDFDDNEPEKFKSLSGFLKHYEKDFCNIDFTYLYDQKQDKWLVAEQPKTFEDFKDLEEVLDTIPFSEKHSDLTYAKLINFFNEITDNQELVDYLKNEKGMKDGSWVSLADAYSIYQPRLAENIADYYYYTRTETGPTMS